MLRMELPCRTNIGIWDTINPIDSASSHIILHPRTVRHFHTIDLNKIFGLTFLISYRGVYNIHGHTSQRLSAKAAIEPLSTRQRQALCCLFVPLPPGEKILAIGVRWHTRSNPCFLVISPTYPENFGVC